jgi:uncharacterized protein (TIGR02145 family)
VGTNPNKTIASSSAASGGSGNLSYVWRRTGTSSATLTGTGTTYALSSDAAGNYGTAGTYYFNRYAKDATCTGIAPVAAADTYTLYVEIANIVQPDGNCTYTEPAVVGTFANFHNTGAYSTSTYTSLTDERDNKIYPVVKINNRWIMARNLNYQKDLYFNEKSNEANGKSFTDNSAGAGTFAIGSFWCPGGNHDAASTSTRESCDVWGALYTWETAMMVDGKWSDDNRNSTTWSEPRYSSNTNTANTNNAGRGAGNHGICPPNWHVLTDAEWGDLLNVMETGLKNHNSATTGYLGTDAGNRGKSKCSAEPPGYTDLSVVNDTQAYWYDWGHLGTDDYGLRVIPSGYRDSGGSYFAERGDYTLMMCSSVIDAKDTYIRFFMGCCDNVLRGIRPRSTGATVRCIRDL